MVEAIGLGASSDGKLPDEEERIKELIIDTIRKEKPGSVRQLFSMLLERSETADLSITDATRLVKELEEEGRIRLSELPRKYRTFSSYLFDRERSISFWLVISAVVLTLASIYALPSEFPWVIPRWIFGSLFVIFLPGYAFVDALFVDPLNKKKELDQIERFALSIGMSLALVPLVGLLLNYTPFGIRLEPIAASLSTFTILCAIAAAYRKFARLGSEIEEGKPSSNQDST